MICVILGPAAGSTVQKRPWLKQLKQKTTELVRSWEYMMWHNGEVEGTGFVQPQKGEYWNLYFCPQIPNKTYREDRARVYCKRMMGNRSWNMRHYYLIHIFPRKVVKYRMSLVRYVTELFSVKTLTQLYEILNSLL